MSDKITTFTTGALRDTQEGKFDFGEYFSPLALARFAEHMRKSATKYGAGNWRKGIPADSALRSLRRHLWLVDMKEYGVELEPETDHLAAVIFNAMIKLHDEEVNKLKAVSPGDTYNGYSLGSFNENKCRGFTVEEIEAKRKHDAQQIDRGLGYLQPCGVCGSSFNNPLADMCNKCFIDG